MSEEMRATPPSTEATSQTFHISQRCGRFSGTTMSPEMVIMQPSLRMVMMTSEMTGSVKAPACCMSPVQQASCTVNSPLTFARQAAG